jgi:transcriptional regulator with XRE-family HTH domain
MSNINPLLQFRKDNNINQVDLANRLGISQAAISLIERSERNITPRIALLIKQVYGIDLPRYIKPVTKCVRALKGLSESDYELVYQLIIRLKANK